MRRIHIAQVNDRFSPIHSNDEYDWDDVISFFAHRKIVDKKEGVTVYNLGKFKRLEECAEADIKISKADGNPYPARSGNNLLGYDGLVLDIDKNKVISDAIKGLHPYEYILYTTHSHMMLKQGESRFHERFRIVIPFADLCPIDEWVKRKDAIERMGIFNGIDHASTSNSQVFYVPSCPESMEWAAQAGCNEASGRKFLDWRDIPVFKKPEVVQRVNTFSDEKLSEERKTELLYKIAKMPLPYGRMGALAWAMWKCDYTYEQFKFAWDSIRDDDTAPARSRGEWENAKKENHNWSPVGFLVMASQGKKNKGY